MFPLHERTQKRVCRIAFFAFAVLPLLVVCGWAIGQHLPFRHNATEVYFAQLFDADVSIQKVEYPTPSKTLLRNVQLRIPGSHPTVATAHRITISELPNGKAELSIAGLRLTKASLEHLIACLQKTTRKPLQKTEPEKYAGFLHYSLVFEDIIIQPNVEQTNSERSENDLHFDRIHIRSLASKTPTQNAKGRKQRPEKFGEPNDFGTGSTTNRIQTQIAFRFAKNTSERAAEEISKADMLAVIGWNTQGEMTSFSLKTANHSVPCWLISAFCPQAGKFGVAACFQGNASVDLTQKNVVCNIEGTIHKANFEELARSLPLGTIQTVGEIQFNHMRWVGSRLVSAQGSLHCNDGRIDSKFIDAAVRALGCKRYSMAREDMARDDTDSILPIQTELNSLGISFDELAFAFTLEESGLTLHGLCKSTPIENSGTILANHGQALLGQPTYERIPVSNLVFFFIPQVQEYLLATREAQGIASWLPLPSVLQHRLANEAADPPETIRK